jgi:hypothetical protein
VIRLPTTEGMHDLYFSILDKFGSHEPRLSNKLTASSIAIDSPNHVLISALHRFEYHLITCDTNFGDRHAEVACSCPEYAFVL